MAIIRNILIAAFRLAGWDNLKKAHRHFSHSISRCVDLITNPVKTAKNQTDGALRAPHGQDRSIPAVRRVIPVLMGYFLAMNDFLGIYLNDQLALGMLWREIARRSQRTNSGTELGEALARVSAGIAEDVETFQKIMRRLGVQVNPVKVGLAVGAERLGRLKLNGRLGTYSPLSRFMELDFLAMGIEGKKLLWTTLRDLAGLALRLPDVDFDGLIERAERQRVDLEPFRVRAGTEALAAHVAAGPAS